MDTTEHDAFIDHILDDAVANPERLNDLKRALRKRMEMLDLSAKSPGRSVEYRLSSAVDRYDDSVWDNVPV
jgi:hypothetical protein